MPLTTTAQNWCDASIWLDDVGGVHRNISGSSNKASIDLNLTLGEVRAFGTVWPARIECGKDATITLEILYTTTVNEAKDILLAWFFAAVPGARTFTLYAPNKNVGSDHIWGEVRLESLSFSGEAGSGDPVMVTAVLRPDGALAHSDVAT
jgi:hypothetical protein